jgi:endonuclease/exonuclease/phosphatase (EEP) superfamily protein YafD
MKILSWNILADEFVKERYYPMIPADIVVRRKQRQQQIINMLEQMDTDVMLLQEVMQTEYNLIAAAFKKTHHIIRGKNIKWQQTQSYSCNVTLLRKTVFTLRANHQNDLKFGLVVRAYVNAQPVVLINVHLDDLLPEKRLKQIEQLLLIIINSEKIILGGDFNENYVPMTGIYEVIKNSGLTIFNQKPTYYVKRQMCIDNIMTKGLVFKKKSAQVVNDFGANITQQYEAYGSDHLPVVLF